jgi:hypothetical protein
VDYGYLPSQEDHGTLKIALATALGRAAKFKLSHARDAPYAHPTAMLRLALSTIRSAGRLFR